MRAQPSSTSYGLLHLEPGQGREVARIQCSESVDFQDIDDHCQGVYILHNSMTPTDSYTASRTRNPPHRCFQRRLPHLTPLSPHRRRLQRRSLRRTQFVILHSILNRLHSKDRLQRSRMALWQEKLLYRFPVPRRQT